MAFFGTPFKSATRAAVLAIVLGASSLAAAPAFAQAGFSIEMQGQGGGRSFDGERRPGGWNDNSGWRCLSNRDVVRGISRYGYNRVEVTRELRRDRVQVRAANRNGLYEMRVDKCTGVVDRVERVRRGGGGRDFHDGGRGPGGRDGGFGFEFNFGN